MQSRWVEQAWYCTDWTPAPLLFSLGVAQCASQGVCVPHTNRGCFGCRPTSDHWTVKLSDCHCDSNSTPAGRLTSEAAELWSFGARYDGPRWRRGAGYRHGP